MGNALTEGVERIVVEDDSPLKDYKNATTSDYAVAKSNFDTLQDTFGDKMTVTEDEFDEIFSLICQDSSEHFKLFDHWELGKVDVMEVFAVILVYCKCSMDEKIPLLFDLFDFDHSKEISESELVLLMLCTTRGLCKVVGLDRPDTAQLEELAQSAFASIDRDHNGQISLAEFAQWATHEPSLVVYLKRFASARLIYDNQVQYDAHMKQLCDQFLTRGGPIIDARGRKQLACSLEQCAEILHKQFPATTRTESAYLVETMQRILLGASSSASGVSSPCLTTSTRAVDGSITLDVFGMVASSYVAFVVADEDQQHAIDLKELKILLWLMRGKEPTLQLVSSVMKSLDRDQNGVLSALEWVSYAVESDARTGNFSFATQIQLLFTCADRNGDALLTIQELITGLKPILLESLCKQVTPDAAAQRELEKEWGLPNDNEDAKAGDEEAAVEGTENPEAAASGPGVGRRQSQANAIHVLVTSLANEFMATLDKNQSHRIEWFEFRQHLDYLEERIHETKDYIRSFVLASTPPQQSTTQ